MIAGWEIDFLRALPLLPDGRDEDVRPVQVGLPVGPGLRGLGLDEKERALQIEIYVDGDDKEKTPRTLTIGALLTEGDKKSYAAQASTLPGDVFAVPEARFEKLLKEGRKFFAKAP